MTKLKLIGSRLFETGNNKDFIVYYYIHINEITGTYGIRLEKKSLDPKTNIQYEYEEEKGITSSKAVAEEVAAYLMDYEVTPISLPETLDTIMNEKE